jgi:hypothetical protein
MIGVSSRSLAHEVVKEARFWRSRPPKINDLRIKNRAFLGFFYSLTCQATAWHSDNSDRDAYNINNYLHLSCQADRAHLSRQKNRTDFASIKVASRFADATDVTQAMQCRLKFKRKEKTFSFFRFVECGGCGLN